MRRPEGQPGAQMFAQGKSLELYLDGMIYWMGHAENNFVRYAISQKTDRCSDFSIPFLRTEMGFTVFWNILFPELEYLPLPG